MLPPFHLVERSSEGIWLAIQFCGSNWTRGTRWHEPPGVFRDRLGQYCIKKAGGCIFCSDIEDLERCGVVECEEAMGKLGFSRAWGEPVDPKDSDAAT
ncbi:MAG: hypothetical protein IOC63_09890 [Methylobacterium sp.]|nr:hypothetical protein [Methylobacterium sp.]